MKLGKQLLSTEKKIVFLFIQIEEYLNAEIPDKQNIMTELDNQIERIKNASPLELPYILMETELHDKQSAYELYEDVSKTFDGEGIIDNVVTPVITTLVDGVLALRCFRGLSRKMGLSSQRVMQECKSFNYEGNVSFLMPDSFVENKNNDEVQQLWGDENRNEYIREQYENKYLMDKYKKEKTLENGSRINMEDEYRRTHDITSTKAKADKRRNDPKNEHNAETDHIIPLHTIFNQLQNNSALSSGDIRKIANQDFNFAVTGRMINNPKRDMSNSEFIKEQDRRKNLGLKYVELNESQRANMIQMERDAQQSIERYVNETVLNNLTGKGQADRNTKKDAIKNKEKEIGRPLSKEERAIVDKELGREKASRIHSGNLENAGKQSLMYLGGNVILLVMKPLYYEIKDSIMNGFQNGVCANSFKEAITIRFSRVKNYVWKYIISIKDKIGTALDLIKDFISTLIEGIIGMFVGVFKQVLRVLKEGVKIAMQAFSVLFGKDSKEMTASEKGDAIVKILGSSVVALCGVGINSLLEKVPFLDDDGRNVVSTILTGLASILLFYVLDKADLFNVKKDKREQRLNEVFEMRIQEIKENTKVLENSVADSIRTSYLLSQDMLKEIKDLSNTDNYKELNRILQQYHDLMFPNNKTTIPNWNC